MTSQPDVLVNYVYDTILLQARDYLELIKEQIIDEMQRKVIKRIGRSLSAGACRRTRELLPFKANQSAYIQLYNLILDNYIRVRSAFQHLDEVFLFILETCFPEHLHEYRDHDAAVFEQVHKKLFK